MIHRFGLVWFLSAGWLAVQAAGQPFDVNRDQRVNTPDLFGLSHSWYSRELGFDLNKDSWVNREDLLRLRSQWGNVLPPPNPYTVGRAVGIYAVIQDGQRTFTSPELEIDITGSAPAGKRWSKPSVASLREWDPDTTKPSQEYPVQSIDSALPALPKDGSPLAAAWRKLHAPAGEGSVPHGALGGVKFGHPSDRIGTFNGWTFWFGWMASFSETYTPESETYAWVCYIAPEGCYLALQEAKSVYSNVDVFASVSSFFGLLYSPAGEYLEKSYINDLLGVSITFDMDIIEAGVTFYRFDGQSDLKPAIQYNFGKSVNFSLIPFPMFLSVSLDNFAQMTAGFYPYILWDMGDLPPGNPIPAVVDQMEKIVAQGGDSLESAGAAQAMNMMLPFMRSLLPQPPVTWREQPVGVDYAHYINEFIESRLPGHTPGHTGVDDLISGARRWLETGQTKQISEELRRLVTAGLPNPLQMYQFNKNLQAASQMSFEVGYKHGYDAAVNEGRREPDTLYAKEIKTVTAVAGKPCSLVVTAAEAAELVAGSQAGDFEGKGVIFDSASPAGNPVTVPIQGGKAVYTFTPKSAATLVFGVMMNPSAATRNQTLELARRVVIVTSQPAGQAYLFGVDQVSPDTPVTVNTTLVDAQGIPVGQAVLVDFFDYKDQWLGRVKNPDYGIAALTFVPEPSIPAIESFRVTRVGYTEEDARDGYALRGRGFSFDADVVFDGVPVNDMAGWDWAVISSREILFLPPDDQSLFQHPVRVQVLNPHAISSNEWLYDPGRPNG